MMKQYTDPYTLDGRVKFQPWVSKKKIEYTKDLVEGVLTGDRQKKGLFESLITTSELGANLAQLVNATVLPSISDEERVWQTVAGTRSVADFRTNYLYTLNVGWNPGVVGDGRVNEPLDTLPTVPEASAYPRAYFQGELIEGSELKKDGLKLGLTFEAIQNDSTGLLQAIPDAFRSLVLNTEERDVFRALVDGVSATQQLQGGSNVDGTTVVPNAPLSREALTRAITELKQRVVNGRSVAVNGGLNLVVPVGQGDVAEFYIQTLQLSEVADGNLRLQVNGYNPLASLTVVESVYVTDNEWYLLPKPGTTSRPVIDRLQLVGHETAELRVSQLTGEYVGGGRVGPFEGSFDADTTDFRVRMFSAGVLWTPDLVVWSDGSGS